MAGGQQTDLGQGALTPEEGVALTGSALTVDSGTIVADAGGGIAIDGEGFDFASGQLASALLIGLRSRKVGAGSAIKALTGASMSVASGAVSPGMVKTPAGTALSMVQGAMAKSRTRLLSGSSSAFSPGTLTFTNQTDATWVGVVPTVTFTQGTGATYDLTQHTLNFNVVQHQFQISTGTLPTGITLNPSAGYVYNGSSPNASANVSVNIVDIAVTTTLTGLDWDGLATGGRRMLYWLNPPPGWPMTYYFKVYFREQTAGAISQGNTYYTTFFWGNNGRFDWGSGYGQSYYGCHPYPASPPLGAGRWEVSADTNDFGVNSGAPRDDGTFPNISADGGANRWYSQCIVASSLGGNNYREKFYFDLPNVTSHYTITHDSSGARVNPPTPSIVVGQAPDFNGLSWGGYARWEEANEIIRGMAFFTGAHTQAQALALQAAETDAQMLAAMAAQGISTSTLYYLNMNPLPTDVTDKSGNGHHGSWAGTARPGSYSSLTADSDFAARVAAVGSNLIRTFSFNTSADLGGGFGAPFGNLPQGGHPAPVIDTTIKASGTGSMRFDCNAALSGSSWWGNLSDNYSVQIDSGQQVNLQFRYRVSSQITADYACKVFLFGTGDTTGTFQSSCTDLEIEMNSQIFGQKHLAAYNACPGSCGAGSIFPFDGGNPGGTRFLAANQWHTIQLQVILGPREIHGGHEWFASSSVKIWIQYEPTPGVPGPEILLYDVILGQGGSPGINPSSSPPCWGLCAGNGGPTGAKYGKMWLLPYNQELDAGAQPGKVWYDDLIIARTKIPAAQA